MATAKLYAPTGEEKGTVELPDWAFAQPIHRHAMWEVVRNYLANIRLGTVADQDPILRQRRRQEAVRAEEDRTGPRGHDSFADLGRRRPRARTQAPKLQLRGSEEGPPSRTPLRPLDEGAAGARGGPLRSAAAGREDP